MDPDAAADLVSRRVSPPVGDCVATVLRGEVYEVRLGSVSRRAGPTRDPEEAVARCLLANGYFRELNDRLRSLGVPDDDIADAFEDYVNTVASCLLDERFGGDLDMCERSASVGIQYWYGEPEEGEDDEWEEE